MPELALELIENMLRAELEDLIIEFKIQPKNVKYPEEDTINIHMPLAKYNADDFTPVMMIMQIFLDDPTTLHIIVMGKMHMNLDLHDPASIDILKQKLAEAKNAATNIEYCSTRIYARG